MSKASKARRKAARETVAVLQASEDGFFAETLQAMSLSDYHRHLKRRSPILARHFGDALMGAGVGGTGDVWYDSNHDVDDWLHVDENGNPHRITLPPVEMVYDPATGRHRETLYVGMSETGELIPSARTEKRDANPSGFREMLGYDGRIGGHVSRAWVTADRKTGKRVRVLQSADDRTLMKSRIRHYNLMVVKLLRRAAKRASATNVAGAVGTTDYLDQLMGVVNAAAVAPVVKPEVETIVTEEAGGVTTVVTVVKRERMALPWNDNVS